MRIFIFTAALVAAFGLFTFTSKAQERTTASPQAIAAVESLSWMAGSWHGEFMGGRFEATYTSGAGGKLLSTSKSFEGTQVGFFEFEVFEARNEDVVLTPHPMGRAAESFKLTKSDGKKAVFENPAVEFPRKLVYQIVDERLVITLTGDQNGKPTKWVFDLRRD
jgi:hypothetical protein